MIEIRIVILVLTALFAVEDLVGAERIVKFEGAWLRAARNTANRFIQESATMITLWARMAGISGCLVVALALGGIAGYGVFKYMAVLGHLVFARLGEHWWSGLLFYYGIVPVALIAGLSLTPAIKAFIIMEETDTTSHVFTLPEYKLAQALLKEWHLERYPRAGGKMLIVQIGVAGTIVPFVLFMSLAMRGAYFAALGIVYVVVFLPSRILKAIADCTGSPSFLKVGKYLVMLFGLILSVVIEVFR